MTSGFSDHYSYNFKLKIGDEPSKATDRFSRPVLFVSFVLGAMLLFLGLYLFSNSGLSGVADIEKQLPKTNTPIRPLVSPVFFRSLIVFIGCFVIGMSYIMFVRYNKIMFDGNYIKVKRRPAIGNVETFVEPLYNYAGVRLRVRFYQFGILNLNKYIVELYHKDESKIVPLYISLRKKNIRQIWKNYAQTLHMPGITISERGMVSRNFQDLSRSYESVVSKWHLPENFIFELEKPKYILFKSRKTGEKMIKIGKVFVDAFSVLHTILLFLLGIGTIYTMLHHSFLVQYVPNGFLLVLYAAIIAIMLYFTTNLITKDIILIAGDKIIVFRKILFFKIRDSIIHVRNIKGIDIGYTPTTDRYYLSVVSDESVVTVGNKLPAEDLRWIRAVLISEIIGN